MENLYIFLVGSAIGSFLNVLIDRLPNNQGINGRSKCDYCHKQIRWYDLIPILSFFILNGKTRCCKKNLSFQYPLVEAVTGVLNMLIFNFQFSIFNQSLITNNPITNPDFILQIANIIALWGIIACLVVIFFSDFKYHLISDYILISFLIFSLLFHLINRITFDQFVNYLLSGIIVGLPIFLLYYLSKERAMGLGDVYLSAIMGFFLGWKAGFIALYIAFLLGAVYGLILIIVSRKKIKSKIAFCPFIVIGILIMLFFQQPIFHLIGQIYNF